MRLRTDAGVGRTLQGCVAVLVDGPLHRALVLHFYQRASAWCQAVDKVRIATLYHTDGSGRYSKDSSELMFDFLVRTSTNANVGMYNISTLR